MRAASSMMTKTNGRYKRLKRKKSTPLLADGRYKSNRFIEKKKKYLKSIFSNSRNIESYR